MFIKEEDGSKRIVFDNLSNVEETLEPGVYSLNVQIHETFFGKQEILHVKKTDKFIGKTFVRAGVYKDIDDLINIHLSEPMKKAKELLKMPNKMGLIFNGLPGTGKTFTAGLIGQRIVEKKNGICIVTTDCNGNRAKRIIEHLRTFTKDPIVWVFDEFEKSVKSNDSELLSLLDGVNSPDNVIFIATSNKTNGLPDFILDRPGRFERIIEFKMEDPIILSSIVSSILPEEYRNKHLIDDVMSDVRKSNNKTIDKIIIIVRDNLSKFLYLQEKNRKKKEV